MQDLCCQVRVFEDNSASLCENRAICTAGWQASPLSLAVILIIIPCSESVMN